MVWLEFKAPEGGWRLYGKERRGEYYPQDGDSHRRTKCPLTKGWQPLPSRRIQSSITERAVHGLFIRLSSFHHVILSFSTGAYMIMLWEDGLYLLIWFSLSFTISWWTGEYELSVPVCGTYWIRKWDILNTKSESTWDFLNTRLAKWERFIWEFPFTTLKATDQALTGKVLIGLWPIKCIILSGKHLQMGHFEYWFLHLFKTLFAYR